MSATPAQLLAQAKQGDPKAIAALMNRSTQPKGITAKVSLKDRCLQVLLEGSSVPDRAKSVEFVRDGMQKLDIQGIDRLKVYGRQVGQETPVWQEEMSLGETPDFDSDFYDEEAAGAASVDEMTDENLLPDDLLEGRRSDDEEMSDTDFPEPPAEAESFLDDDMNLEYDDDLYVEEGEDDLYMDETDDGAEEFAEEESDEAEAASSGSKSKSGALVGGVLAVLLLLVLGGGYYLYTTRPELFANLPFLNPSNPEAPAPDATDSETDTSEQQPEGAAAPTETEAATNPFSEAVNAAMDASQQAQTAQTPDEWQAVADLWQEAVENMQAVPQDNPQYDLAQQKAQEYQRNLQYAQQQAQ